MLSITSMAPRKRAYQPINHAMASAPAAGFIMTRKPKTTAAMPLRASQNSPVISLRRRMAATILKTPVASAQAATKNSSATVVMPGARSVKMPAPIPNEALQQEKPPVLAMAPAADRGKQSETAVDDGINTK
jgi:hypothetical protein